MNNCNVLAVIAYDGTRYSGYQKQPNELTIQNVLEEKIGKLFNELVNITASGRTDKGVHADEQMINFFVNKDLMEKITIKKLPKILNDLLPKDIYVKKTLIVSNDFHARFSARVRMYRYQINLSSIYSIGKELNHYYRFSSSFNLEEFQRYLDMFEGYQDFSTFSSIHDSSLNKYRHLFKIDSYIKGSILVIDLYANAFLRSMVRSIIGNCLFFYQKKKSVNIVKEWLKACDPLIAKHRVPANALTLKKVFYSPIFKDKTIKE